MHSNVRGVLLVPEPDRASEGVSLDSEAVPYSPLDHEQGARQVRRNLHVSASTGSIDGKY